MEYSRALVTGACGFVGSHLAGLLVERGVETVLVDDLSLGAPSNLPADVATGSPLMAVDIRNKDGIAKVLRTFEPEVVFHLAAIHFIPDCDRDPARAVSVNAAGTQAVLDAAGEAPSVKCVVFASTAAVYAPSQERHAESSEIGPTDVYGLTKLWGEQAVGLFAKRTGIEVRIARLFNVFGPVETNAHLIPTVIRQLEAGAELSLGNLETRRDYIFVEDVASALAAMPSATVPAGEDGPPIFNVGSERAVSGEEIVEAVARTMGREAVVQTDPSRVRKSDRPNLESDCARAHEVLGWRAEVPLEEGLPAALARPLAAGVDFR